MDGKSFNDIYTEPRVVNALYLKCYEGVAHPYFCPRPVTVQSKAHFYGETIQRTTCSPYKTTDDIVESRYNSDYYYSLNATNPAEFAYRFKEYKSEDTEATYSLFTNRTITASAGECLIYPIKNNTKGLDIEGKGYSTIFIYSNNTFTEQIQIPQSSLGGSGTTYMYKGIQAPDRTEDRCGPRCM